MSTAPQSPSSAVSQPELPAEPVSLSMVVLFTDLVDSTSWKSLIGDAGYTQHVLQPHNELFVRLLRDYPGAALRNFMGDGFLAKFEKASDAVSFALRFQYELHALDWHASVRDAKRLVRTRVGIHQGEAIEYPDTATGQPQLSGQAVDLGGRVMGLAEAAQILMTRSTFDSARQYIREFPVPSASLSLDWLAHGAYRFKGRDEDPLEVFEVGARGFAPLTPPADSEKAKRAVSDEEARVLGWRPSAGAGIPGREDFLIEKKIGEGGFGEVWLARQKRTKNERVFKFCFDPERLRSFQRELTIFRLLQTELGHRPDIVFLHSVRTDQPPYYLESDYIPAGNLTQWAERQGGIQAVPLATRLRLLAEVAQAVSEAHRIGIIHKDLKPSNLLIAPDRDGVAHPRVIDFGIGVVTDRDLLDRHGITAHGFTQSLLQGNNSSRTGTRLYAAPEYLTGGAVNRVGPQPTAGDPASSTGTPARVEFVTGKSARPTTEASGDCFENARPAPRAGVATTAGDVYSLGVMLFQMVVGDLDRPLATGWQDELADDVSALPDDPAVPADILRKLLTDDVYQATLRDPSRRLASALDFANRLQSLLTTRLAAELDQQAQAAIAAQAIRDREVAEHRALKAVKRSTFLRRVLIAGAAVLVLVSGLSVWAWQQRNLATERAGELTKKNQTLDQQKTELNQQKQNAEQREAATLRENSNHLWRSAVAHRDAKDGDQLLASHLFLRGAQTLFQIQPAYQTNSDRSLMSSEQHAACVIDRCILRVFKHDSDVHGAQFSRDESRVLTWSNDKTARWWDVTTSEPLQTFKHDRSVNGAQFSRDESRVLTWSKDNTARLRNASDPLAILTPDERILELEVRSGTKLDGNLKLRALSVEEWQTKARSPEYRKLLPTLPTSRPQSPSEKP